MENFKCEPFWYCIYLKYQLADINGDLDVGGIAIKMRMMNFTHNGTMNVPIESDL